MNFGSRGFQSGFKRGTGFWKGARAQSGQFRNFARMQAHMNFSQMAGLRKQVFMIQLQ